MSRPQTSTKLRYFDAKLDTILSESTINSIGLKSPLNLNGLIK